MPRRRRIGFTFNEIAMPILIVVALLAIWLFFTYAGPSLPGSGWDTVSSNLLALWPYLTIFGVGVAAICTVYYGRTPRSIKHVFFIPVMAAVGIILSLIVIVFADESVIDVTGTSTTALSTLIITGCIVFGIMMGVMD